MPAITLSRPRIRRPDDRMLVWALLGISGAGSLGTMGLLLAGEPALALRAFSGAVLLDTLLLLAEGLA